MSNENNNDSEKMLGDAMKNLFKGIGLPIGDDTVVSVDPGVFESLKGIGSFETFKKPAQKDSSLDNDKSSDLDNDKSKGKKKPTYSKKQLKAIIDEKIEKNEDLIIEINPSYHSSISVETLKKNSNNIDELIKLEPRLNSSKILSSEQTAQYKAKMPQIKAIKSKLSPELNITLDMIEGMVKAVSGDEGFATTATFLAGLEFSMCETAKFFKKYIKTDKNLMRELLKMEGENQAIDLYGYKVSRELERAILLAEADIKKDENIKVLDAVVKRILDDKQTIAYKLIKGMPNVSKIAEEFPVIASAAASTGDLSDLNRFKELVNLNKKMQEYKPVLTERNKELEQIEEALCKMEKKNVLLLGEAGVGKTALVEYLASLLAEGKSLKALNRKTIFELQTSRLVADSGLVGDIEKKFYKLMDAIEGRGDVILFVDEMHTMIGAGQGLNSNNSIAQMFKPSLARGDISMIGATTEKEYNRIIKTDEAFSRRFEVIKIKEPTAIAALQMLKAKSSKYEEFHNIVVDIEQLKRIIDGCRKHIKDRKFPDKAMDILDRVCVKATKAREDRNVKITITNQHIDGVFKSGL